MRRVALNLGRLIRGASTAELPVPLSVDMRLMIDARTAVAAGRFPNVESDSAARTLEALLGRHPAYADAYVLLGAIYERQGRTDDARALYTKALDTVELSRQQQFQVASRLQALGEAAAE